MRIHLLICARFVAALVFANPVLAQLTYVEQSSGLNTPTMEGGNTEIEFGDVNGDGHIDIVSIGDHGSPYVNAQEHGVMVWFGDGTGAWSVYQSGSFGYGGVALGDVNNDGLMDVGYGMHHNYSGVDFGNQILEVALGDGTGQNWDPWDDGLATNGEDWGMFGTDFADVDNDGDLDVGSVSFGCCAGVHVYRNNGDGTWTQSFGFLGGNSNMYFKFGDVNGDGFADFAAAHGYGTVYLGDGQGGFTLADGNLPSSSYGLRGISLGDVNDDGREDLAFVTSGGGLDVYSWVSPGVWQDLSGTLPASGSFDLAQIADMDLDGHGDILAFAAGGYSGSPGQITIYGGDGAGNWQQIASFSTPSNCDYAAFRAGVDVDHNGFPDLAVVQEEYVGGFPISWRNRPRAFVESSTPTSTWIHPKYPRGGETFVAGSVRFVEWTAAVAEFGPGAVTVEFSRNGLEGPWSAVAVDVPDNGRYQWQLPQPLPTSRNCYLRYTLTTGGGDAVAVTPDSFTIEGTGILGDLDGDGDVDLSDLGQLLAHYGTPSGASYEDGDIDGDGDVDLADVAALLANYGYGVP